MNERNGMNDCLMTVSDTCEILKTSKATLTLGLLDLNTTPLDNLCMSGLYFAPFLSFLKSAFDIPYSCQPIFEYYSACSNPPTESSQI